VNGDIGKKKRLTRNTEILAKTKLDQNQELGLLTAPELKRRRRRGERGNVV